MNNNYYCYSRRLAFFCRAFGIRSVGSGKHMRTGAEYIVFQKSEKLDKVIVLWNKVKTMFGDYDEHTEGAVNDNGSN